MGPKRPFPPSPPSPMCGWVDGWGVRGLPSRHLWGIFASMTPITKNSPVWRPLQKKIRQYDGCSFSSPLYRFAIVTYPGIRQCDPPPSSSRPPRLPSPSRRSNTKVSHKTETVFRDADLDVGEHGLRRSTSSRGGPNGVTNPEKNGAPLCHLVWTSDSKYTYILGALQRNQGWQQFEFYVVKHLQDHNEDKPLFHMLFDTLNAEFFYMAPFWSIVWLYKDLLKVEFWL